MGWPCAGSVESLRREVEGIARYMLLVFGMASSWTLEISGGVGGSYQYQCCGLSFEAFPMAISFNWALENMVPLSSRRLASTYGAS